MCKMIMLMMFRLKLLSLLLKVVVVVIWCRKCLDLGEIGVDVNCVLGVKLVVFVSGMLVVIVVVFFGGG